MKTIQRRRPCLGSLESPNRDLSDELSVVRLRCVVEPPVAKK